MADTLLYDLADRLLEVATDALDDPPARTYVTDGDPTRIDTCRFLAVALAPNGLSHSTSARARGSMVPALPTPLTNVRTARFAVFLISTDCWPTMVEGAKVPDPADISAAAELVLMDRMDLWTALRDEAAAGTLFDDLLDHGKGGVEVAGPTTALGPGGETAGTRVEVYVELMRLPDLGS